MSMICMILCLKLRKASVGRGYESVVLGGGATCRRWPIFRRYAPEETLQRAVDPDRARVLGDLREKATKEMRVATAGVAEQEEAR